MTLMEGVHNFANWKNIIIYSHITDETIRNAAELIGVTSVKNSKTVAEKPSSPNKKTA